MGTKDHFNSASQARLERLYARLSVVPEGAEVVSMLKYNTVDVVFDPKREVGAYTNITFGHTNGRHLSYKDFEIITCEKADDDYLIQAIVHEAQHVRHHTNSLGNPEFERTQEQECILRRTQEADAQTKATEICWLLKQAGDTGPWKAAQNSLYSEMCNAFESEMEKSGDRTAARRAAFDAWFLDDRLYFYDYNSVFNTTGAVGYLVKNDLSDANKAAAQESLTSTLHFIGGLTKGPQNYLDLPGAARVDGPPYTRNLAENIADARVKIKAANEAAAAKAASAAKTAKPRKLLPAA